MFVVPKSHIQFVDAFHHKASADLRFSFPTCYLTSVKMVFFLLFLKLKMCVKFNIVRPLIIC
jgi:hypothetical protein